MANFSADYISPDRVRSALYSFSGGDCSNRGPSSSCIVSVLSSILERSVSRNDRLATPNTMKKYPVFNGGRVPDMSIERYLQRILKHTNVSTSVFVVAYAYIDRLCEFHPDFRINSMNVHRILITTVMVASKFVEDLNYRNSYYATIGGLEVWEINELEVEFLFMIKFKLQVSVSVFESYCSHLEREVGMGGGYEIERTLRMVCGRHNNRGRPRPDAETPPQRMAVTM